MLEQLAAPHDAFVVLHQVREQVEHARLDMLQGTAQPQLARVAAQLAPTEVQSLGSLRTLQPSHAGPLGAEILHATDLVPRPCKSGST